MRLGAHTNTSTHRAHKKLRVILSSCLAMVFACVIGAFALLHMPDPSQSPQEPNDSAASAAIDESSQDEANDSPSVDAPEEARYQEAIDIENGYRSDEIIISIDENASATSVNQMLAGLDFAQTKDVSDQNISRGFVLIKLVDGADVNESLRSLALVGIKAQPNFVYTLASEEDSAYPDLLGSLKAQTAVAINDPYPNVERWGLDSVDAPRAWAIEKCGLSDEGTQRGDRVSVAVIDTGCLTSHIDLKDNIVATYNSYTKTTGPTAVTDTIATQNNGHGTHVSGIVAAKANNGTGVAGVSYDAGVVVIKALLADTRSFTTDTLSDAYDWLFSTSSEDPTKSNAEYYNVRVVNMSVGGPQKTMFIKDDELTERIKEAYDGSYADGETKESILTVGAAGNQTDKYPDNTPCTLPYVNYPGDNENVLSVIGLKKADNTWTSTNNRVKRNDSSNYNVDQTHVKNISAPGHNIGSTINEAGKYQALTGTSMASPFVAGVAALVFSENPSLNASDVTKIIEATAYDLEEEGWDQETGYGEINAYHALQITSAELTGSDEVEYMNKSDVKLEYGDGTSWETYGSPSDWNWSIDNDEIGKLNIDEANKDLSLVLTAPGSVTLTGVYKDVEGNPMPSITVSKTVTMKPLDISKAEVTASECAYTGHEITPKPIVTVAGNELVEGVDYTTEYSNNVELGDATITITGIGHASGTATGTFKIAPASIHGAAMSALPNVPYNGTEYTPTPTVTLEGFGVLEEGEDFDYEYEDNLNAGQARVRVVGKGYFADASEWLVFTIMPVNLSNAKIGDIESLIYTGNPFKPEPTVTRDDGILVTKDVDYTLSYSNNIDASRNATVTVTGFNNYYGSVSKNFTIEPYDISEAVISGFESSYVFTGSRIEPSVAVSLPGRGTLGADSYTVSYSDNVNAGTATVKVTGKGNYSGTASTTFLIEPCDLANTQISDIPAQIYTSGYVTPVPTIKLGSFALVSGHDFSMHYENNVNTGVATAIVTGKGNFTGSVTKTFNIALSINPDMVSPIPDQPYTGKKIEPGITVSTAGMALQRNEDYSVEFSNNVDVGTATVKIKGIKGTAGETTVTFKIVPIDISDAAIAPMSTYTYTGNPITPTPAVSLYGFGELKKDKDFTYEYRLNTDAGAAQLRIVGKGNFKGVTDWMSTTFTIGRSDISSASVSIPSQSYTGSALEPDITVKAGNKTLVKGADYRVSYFNNVDSGTATAVIEGRGNYRGTKTATFKINASILPSMISIASSPTYTGNAVEPDVVVRDSNGTLTEGKDYEISGYKNNVNAGTATVTVKGKGAYSGSASKDFTIDPCALASVDISVDTQTYTGKALTPNPKVTLSNRGTLVKGKDYTVSYSNNTDVGTGTIVITGKGNYTGTRKTNFAITGAPDSSASTEKREEMHRLYNPNSGEHFYTASTVERDSLKKAGWKYEGPGWTAPSTSNTPVYRLYNANAGDHHYTTSLVERNSLISVGWKDEGIGWYSDDQQRVPLYRQYNPNATAGSHNYTTSRDEHTQLIKAGWKDEGISWYGM